MPIQWIIHFGPPKTGTSAIQKCLVENRQLLLGHGIHYPRHDLDEHGVSFGNFFALFDKSRIGRPVISNAKRARLERSARKSRADAILLSSEYFFRHLDELAAALPDAVFVGYVRFPLDSIESAYNQWVKRAFETRRFDVNNFPVETSLDLISRYVSTIGSRRFVLRPFDWDLFAGKGVTADFCSTLGLPAQIGAVFRIVNRSYGFEALEVMRWFNQFANPRLQAQLDRYFQQHECGRDEYSVILPDEYRQMHRYHMLKVEHFFMSQDIGDCSAFLQRIREKVQRPYREQHLPVRAFEEVVRSVVSRNTNIVKVLQRDILRGNGPKEREEFVSVVQEIVSSLPGVTGHRKLTRSLFA